MPWLQMVPAGQTAHGWSLKFEIPGAQITRVWGAQWEPSGNDGGLATMLGRQPGPGPGSPGGQNSQGSGGPGPGWRQWQSHHGWWPAHGNGFLVVGQGRPVTPVGCVLNHATCHFG